MILVPKYGLKSGMVLAKNTEVSSLKDSKAFLLTKGSILNEHIIEKLDSFNISGLYIDDGRENKIMDDEFKYKSVAAIKSIFDICEEKNEILNNDSIRSIEEISRELSDKIYANKDITIGISDLQTYDENTYYHSLSVTVISIAIGTELGFSKEKLYELGASAMLHDIGKVDIPVELITKPSRLTSEEFNVVKEHAELGGKFVINNELINEDIYGGIISHHEKFDGTGYPYGIKGYNIPIFARVISVADVYDALTGNRPYRNPIRPSEAIEYIMGNSGISFDIDIVRAFLRKIEPYPIGASVRLSDGRQGIVIRDNINNPLRPVVKLRSEREEVLDLTNDFSLNNIVIKGIDYDYLVKR